MHQVCTSYSKEPSIPILFNEHAIEGIHMAHNDALVIVPMIDNVKVQRVLVDGGTLTNVLAFLTDSILG